MKLINYYVKHNYESMNSVCRQRKSESNREFKTNQHRYFAWLPWLI